MIESTVLAAKGKRRVLARGVAAITIEEMGKSRKTWARVWDADVAEIARMLIINPASLRCAEYIVEESEEDEEQEKELESPKGPCWWAYGRHATALFRKDGQDVCIIAISVPLSVARRCVDIADGEKMVATGK